MIKKLFLILLFCSLITNCYAVTFDKVDVVAIANNGSPTGNMTMRIETETAGLPSGTLAHANGTLTQAWTASATNTFDFTNFSLSAGTYWIVFVCDNQLDDNSFAIGMDFDPSPDYLGDIAKSVDAGATWANWSTGTYSMTMTIYYDSTTQSNTDNTNNRIEGDYLGVEQRYAQQFTIAAVAAPSGQVIWIK